VLALGNGIAGAQVAEPVEGMATVLNLVAERPVVRVIARLRAPTSVAPTEFVGATLAGAQAELVETMLASNARYAQPIANLPLVVLELEKSQLETLLASGQIARGNGQAVAVLDTGVDRNHPFLAGRVVDEGCFSSNSPTFGASTVCPNGQTNQTGPGAAAPCGVIGCNHGTHVAGIAAGRGNAFSGVAPDANIVAVQVFSRFDDSAGGPQTCANSGRASPCTLTFTSDQIRGLQHVRTIAASRAVAAANMSLGGGRNTTSCDSDSRKAVIDQLRTDGVATVIASGNDGFTDAVGAPGCISTAVTVGSTTKSDVVSSFSNSASMVDLLAPGSSINSSVPGTGFAIFNGTSMATPHVAGAFAALRSAVPGASVGAIEVALASTGVPITDARNGLVRQRINVLAALNQLRQFTVGTFSPGAGYAITNGQWVPADFNGDGKTDIIHAVENSNYVHTWLSNGNGTFTVGTFSPGVGYAVTNGQWLPADFNGDGRTDIIHAVENSNYVHTWLSNGGAASG
jgi:subtilisin family serine protease